MHVYLYSYIHTHMTLGRNDHGQLGTGDFITYPIPVVLYVYIYLSSYLLNIYTYMMHIYLYMYKHTQMTIGRNDHGQLGTGDIITYPTPVVLYVYIYIHTYIHTYIQTNTIHNTYLFIHTHMTLVRNDHGQLGTGDIITYPTPVVLHIYTYLYTYI
jgi:alpha-tubulin suppressor-like RCC1 family protein